MNDRKSPIKNDWGKQLSFAGVVGLLFLMIALVLSEDKKIYERFNTAEESLTWIGSVLLDAKTSQKVSTDSRQEKKEDYHDALDLSAQWVSGESARRMVFLTAFQVIFGVAGLIALIVSLNLNRAAALSAQRAVDITEDTAKKELRAYISASPRDVYFFGVTTKSEMTWRIVNHGQTPANHVTQIGRVDIFPYPLPPDFVFPPITAQHANPFTLHPTMEMFCSGVADRSFTATEIAAITKPNGNQRLHLYGEIKYRDIYGEEHITRFCSHVGTKNLAQISQDRRVTPAVDIDFHIAGTGNHAS